jgi:hypothetical protein
MYTSSSLTKVKTQDGSVLGNILKDKNGTLVVIDDKEYNKYKTEKERERKINELQDQVSQLTALVNKLLENNG